MINQMIQNENTQNRFSDAMRELQIGKLLRRSNITKSCGVSAYEVFQFQKGFTLLTLGWSDGYSFVPVGFNLLSSEKKSNRYQDNSCTLPELQKFVRFDNVQNIFGSVVVTTKHGIPVKIVIIRNRNKRSECLYLLSTDCSLSDAEIVRIYGNRWSIECFFKAANPFLKLGTEFQSRSYNAMVSHAAIVFTGYIILEWIRRNENDEKTYDGLFFMFCEDIQDMDLTTALQSLMTLFVEQISTLSADITAFIKSKVTTV